MKAHYFLIVPVSNTAPTYFFSAGAKDQWIKALAAELKCNYVERFRCRLGPAGPVTWAWVDEEGHVTGKPHNGRVSFTLYPGPIAGPVAIDIGVHDLDDANAIRKWERYMARMGTEFYGITVPDKVTPHGQN